MHWWQLVSAVIVERRASWAGDGGAGGEEADGAVHSLVLTARAVIVEGANGSQAGGKGRNQLSLCRRARSWRQQAELDAFHNLGFYNPRDGFLSFTCLPTWPPTSSPLACCSVDYVLQPLPR